MQNFKDKVAVITGAGRGIGRGIALRCAQEQMKIVLAGIGMESLNKTNADLQAIGAETLIVQTDVSKPTELENLAQKTIERFGTVHMLFNNAGVSHFAKPWEASLDDWDWVLGVNLWGVIHGIRAFIPIMIQQNTPCHIVNVSSVAGAILVDPELASYSVSKQGVVALSEALYSSLAQHAPQIKVSVYMPGAVNTDIMTSKRNRQERFQEQVTPDQFTAESLDGWTNFIASGLSIEESASVLFDGIHQNKLYIGIKGFVNQVNYAEAVKYRMNNIINETNPDLSS